MLLCRYLHQRLKGFDFDQLFVLHYNLITMGKVPACSLHLLPWSHAALMHIQ